MTEQEQRIAIAEACGFQWYRIPQSTFGKLHELRCLFLPAVHEYEGQSQEWLVKADGTEHICNMEYMSKEGLVPDYLHDLNAMNEAEEFVIVGQNLGWDYCNQLNLITGAFKQDPEYCATEWESVHAKASQRAEAFLRTIGKWKD